MPSNSRIGQSALINWPDRMFVMICIGLTKFVFLTSFRARDEQVACAVKHAFRQYPVRMRIDGARKLRILVWHLLQHEYEIEIT